MPQRFGPIRPRLRHSSILKWRRVLSKGSMAFYISHCRSEMDPNMQKAKEYLELTDGDSEAVSRLDISGQRVGNESSFYEVFALRGIRVDRVEPGLVVCTFKVPPRLTVSLYISHSFGKFLEINLSVRFFQLKLHSQFSVKKIKYKNFKPKNEGTTGWSLT